MIHLESHRDGMRTVRPVVQDIHCAMIETECQEGESCLPVGDNSRKLASSKGH